MNDSLMPCPECGSSDVSRHLIETRPHCNSCGFWSPNEWGSREEAVKKWNELSETKWQLKEIPKRVESLEERVAKLENVQKMDTSKPEE